MLASIAKAGAAFLAIVVANLWAQLTATGAVWPHNTSGWVALVVSSVVGSFGVWLKSNFTTNAALAENQSVRLKNAPKA